jgi:hypothetical protein
VLEEKTLPLLLYRLFLDLVYEEVMEILNETIVEEEKNDPEIEIESESEYENEKTILLVGSFSFRLLKKKLLKITEKKNLQGSSSVKSMTSLLPAYG